MKLDRKRNEKLTERVGTGENKSHAPCGGLGSTSTMKPFAPGTNFPVYQDTPRAARKMGDCRTRETVAKLAHKKKRDGINQR